MCFAHLYINAGCVVASCLNKQTSNQTNERALPSSGGAGWSKGDPPAGQGPLRSARGGRAECGGPGSNQMSSQFKT